jgi:serine/threonine-protein kinase
MRTTLTLRATCGSRVGATFRFAAPARVVLGRADDCDIRLTGAAADIVISRHHCLVEVGPAGVRVCDLGSRNGTFVNGVDIRSPAPAEDDPADAWRFALADGDTLRLGARVFAVEIAGAADPADACDRLCRNGVAV